MKINEIIIVEGKYDKNAVLQIADAAVIDVGGFAIFNNTEMKKLLHRLACERGVIILTDSDSAGFLIRNHLKGLLPKDKIKHAYIPDIYGKERRKVKASREQKMGVEGMAPEVLKKALENAGATFSDGSPIVTKADFYEWGLSGGEGSEARRKALKKRLGLPERLSSKALIDVLCALYTREEIEEVVITNNPSAARRK